MVEQLDCGLAELVVVEAERAEWIDEPASIPFSDHDADVFGEEVAGVVLEVVDRLEAFGDDLFETTLHALTLG